MVFLVTNCYHWVGFHIVNKLLETGYNVDGYDQLSKKDNHLSMFLGRNSCFTFVQDMDVKDYRASIVVGDEVPLYNLKSERIIKIANHIDNHNENPNIVTIKKPMLYGEWMPMDEKGIYHNKTYVSFQSNEFNSNAIYINDFTNVLLQWLKSSILPAVIDIYTEKDKSISYKLLENTVIIRDNILTEKKVNKLISHYKRNKSFYA